MKYYKSLYKCTIRISFFLALKKQPIKSAKKEMFIQMNIYFQMHLKVNIITIYRNRKVNLQFIEGTNQENFFKQLILNILDNIFIQIFKNK